jgi:hypothetical protein
VYDDVISEIKREIRKPQSAIRELEDAELEAEMAKENWTRWLLSLVYSSPRREGSYRFIRDDPNDPYNPYT